MVVDTVVYTLHTGLAALWAGSVLFVAAVTGREPGAEIRPGDVATLLTHEDGGLKRVPDDARVVVLLNMVDDAELEAAAREVADEVLAHPRVDRVVLGRMDLRMVVDVLE